MKRKKCSEVVGGVGGDRGRCNYAMMYVRMTPRFFKVVTLIYGHWNIVNAENRKEKKKR